MLNICRQTWHGMRLLLINLQIEWCSIAITVVSATVHVHKLGFVKSSVLVLYTLQVLKWHGIGAVFTLVFDIGHRTSTGFLTICTDETFVSIECSPAQH